MRIITINPTLDMETLLFVANDGVYEYEGPIADFCGATQQPKDLEAAQAAFYNEQTKQYNTVFGESQGILKNLTAQFTPILQAGPNQQGFSAAELNNLNSTAVTGSGQAYHSIEQALAQQEAAQGGGNDYLPSGAKLQLQEELAASAAQNVSAQESQIQQANYETGRQNFQFASSVLGNTAGQLNPAGFSNATTASGTAAGGCTRSCAGTPRRRAGPGRQLSTLDSSAPVRSGPEAPAGGAG